MSPSPSPPSTDYGSEPDWDAPETQAQLAAAEAGAVRPSMLGDGDGEEGRRSAVGGEEEGAAAQGEVEDDGTAAARLAEALREFGVEQDSRSLWERYRKHRGWGALSVSDLSGPSWCEVQHSYRLASKSHLPPLERPTALVAPSGQSISIDLSRTVAREAVLDRGRAVHAQIEKEVMGEREEVRVEVTAKEEWWALRVLNLLVCLETLLETGRVREVPVVGFVRDFLVFGVIDEIERREIPLPCSPSPPPATYSQPAPPPASVPAISRPKKGMPEPATPEKDPQRTLKQFFAPVASPLKKGKERAVDQDAVVDLMEGDEQERAGSAARKSGQARSRTGFVLSDTKTRFNRSLPSESDSLAARLQLMLYHRLFTSLLQPEPPPSSSPAPPSTPPLSGASPPFPWSRLYARLSLDPSAALSSTFLSSIAPLLTGASSFALSSLLSPATTLESFVATLAHYGDLLRGDRPPGAVLEEEMEISYRLREARGGRWKGGRSAVRARERVKEGRGKAEEVEDRALQRAIEMSLQVSAPADGGADAGGSEAPAAMTDDLAPALARESIGVDDVAEATTAMASVEDPDTLNSQLEDSQLPFLANPSLPLPFPPPDDLLITRSVSSPPALDLPFNSQASSTPDAPPATRGARHPPRYNLRRRAPPPEVASVAPDDTTALALSPDSPPRKRARSASPAADAPSQPAVPSAASSSSSLSSAPSSSPSSTSSSTSDPDPSFIGLTAFRLAPSLLSAHLTRVLAYWTSQRAPVGVELSEVGRCRSCEFEEGCEWREGKAREVQERARGRRAEKEAAKEAAAAARREAVP
ncbi:hypothetical protein JCM10207_000017 [Rhodosporidiobolus poonsookiae]